MEKQYTVKELASLSGVTVRTLHHYDEIGLLKPAHRAGSGYRYYGRKELMRLQQILFYRELEMPLEKIAALLDDPEFDALSSLQFQRGMLNKRAKQIATLLKTIDKTIQQIQKEKDMITDKELFEGFEPGQGEAYRQEAIERWGKHEIETSEKKLQNMSRQEFEILKNEGHEILLKLAVQMQLGTDNPGVQETVAAYHHHINRFAETDKERFALLGEMYADDERFAKYFENYASGLAVFLRDAIRMYCSK